MSKLTSLLPKLKGWLLTCLSPWWAFYLRLRGVKVGDGFTCIGRPGINLKRGTRIQLGNNVTLCNTGMANPVAEYGRCRLATVGKGAEIILHDNVGLSSCLICAASKVEIGENTIIGGGAMILDTDFHQPIPGIGWGNDAASVSKPVQIGKHCFIGARAVILKGVTLGDNVVVAAGAVINRPVPENSVAYGNPAIYRTR